MSSKQITTNSTSPNHQSSLKSSLNKLNAHPGDSGDFEDINVIKLISTAKFPVYLVSSLANNQNYALKVFNYENGQPHPYYKNEARFAVLDHPHVIKVVHTEKDTIMPNGAEDNHVSCIMMEYAPHGDFFDFVKNYQESLTEKLIRTYFRQLIEGLEYLHSQGVCHLDLKLENLLLGADYKLKIADFDLSYISGDSKVLTRGTRFYRSPELKDSRCRDGPAADVYAAGVILFVLKSGGIIPHAEGKLHEGVDLFQLLKNNTKDFFARHCSIQQRNESFFDGAFRELFVSMTNEDVSKRITIDGIKSSKWYRGAVYNPKDLKTCVQKLFEN